MTECRRPRRAGLGLLALAALIYCAGNARAADSGVLFITSSPPGVAVSVDGRLVGETPVSLQRVAPGEHTVTVSSPLYEDSSRKVTVTAGQAATASFALVPARSDFTLQTDLVGAKVAVDGRAHGVVEEGKPITVTGLLAGPHTLTLTGRFFRAERTFGIQKGVKTELSMPAASAAGSLSVSSTIPATGLRINGVVVAEGPGPYKVSTMAPGSYDVEVATTPYPYHEKVEIRAGDATRVDLDATRDTGKLILTSVLVGENEIRIDGILVEVPALKRSSVPPLVVEGIVKGQHNIEILGVRKTGELDSSEEPLMMGRGDVWVPGGGTASVDFSSDRVSTGAGDRCAGGMVMIPGGITEGEFWFKNFDTSTGPTAGAQASQPGDAYRALPLQGKPFEIAPAGVELTLKSVSTSPASFSGRRDLSSDPLSDHTSYFQANAREPFCIDIYEYPNRRGSKPVQMSYFDAAAACEEAGKRLCTSVEWVRACSGPQKYMYPYGDEYQPARCNTLDNPRSRGLAAAGSYAGCVNGYGLYDMSGNAAEWTVADFSYVVRGATGRDESELGTPSLIYDPALKVIGHHEGDESPKLDYRGGSWMSSDWDASCRAMPGVAGNYIGTDDRPSFTEQLIAAWPDLDPETELPAAQGALQAFMKQWNEGTWRSTAEAGLTKGMLRGRAGYVRALEMTAFSILEGLGRGTTGGGGAILGTGTSTTVDRASGLQTRYLGSARLRGFRCCSYVRGPQIYSLSASASGLSPSSDGAGQTAAAGQAGGSAAGGSSSTPTAVPGMSSSGSMGPAGPGGKAH